MEPFIALFCNPSSENTRALRITEEVGGHLKQRGIPHLAFTESWPADLARFTQIWIIGGDGTLNYFINQFPDVRVPLAAIPGGSGNDFHWMLYGGELGLPQLLERLLKGNTRAIDVGSCNGRLFLNGLGIGFDGAIVRDLLGKKKLAGKASYLLSVLKHILTYHESQVGVVADGTELRRNALLVSVANGTRYGGDFKVAPRAKLDDGLLDVNFVGAIAPLQRMRYLPVIERGEHLELPFVWYRQAADIVIDCAQELPAHLDGEYLTAARFEVRCLPKKFVFCV
ncbi:MAG: YegS/Rv2252/BmrU family lipid kinase [Chitinophagaceae bacterium]|nr:MAG: YegS/Rv2252/BmrU family lipid kinase [Chitinophagaceae bacterium]